MQSLSPQFLSSGCSPLSHGALWHKASNNYFYISGQNIISSNSPSFHTNGLITNPKVILMGHTQQIKSLCSLNDQHIVSTGSDLSIRIWDASASSCDPVNVLKWPSGPTASPCSILVICAVVDLLDRTWIVAGDSTGLIVVYLQVDPSIHEFKVHQTWSCSHVSTAMAITSIRFDQHSFALVLAIASANSKLTVYVLDPNTFLFANALTVSHFDNWISSLDFTTVTSSAKEWANKDGYHCNDVLLASGSYDKLIRIMRFSFISNLESALTIDSVINNGGQLSTKAYSIPCPLRSPPNNSDHTLTAQLLHITLDAVMYGHEDWIYSVKWSPINQSIRLASCSADQSALIWQLEDHTWTSVARLGHQSGGTKMALHCIQWRPADGHAVAVTGSSGAVHLFIEELEPNVCWVPDRVCPSGHIGPVQDLVWHPYNALAIVTTSLDQTTRVWAGASVGTNAITPDCVLWAEWARPQIHGYDLNVLAFASNKVLVSGADEKVVRVFQMPSSYATALHLANILPSLDLMGVDSDLHTTSTPIGANLPALGLSNKPITSQDVTNSSKENEYLEHQSYTVTGALATKYLNHPAKQHQALQSSWQPPFEQDLLQHTLWPEVDKLYGHGSEIMCIATSPILGLVASACKASSPSMAVIRIYDTKNWTHVASLGPDVHALTITSIQFSPVSGDYIISASRDRSWALWNRVQGSSGKDTWQLVMRWEKAHARIIWDATWSPDESFFVTGSRDKHAKVWALDQQTKSVTLQATLVADSAVTSVSVFKPMENTWYLALGLESGTILVYQRTTCHGSGTEWNQVKVLNAHSGAVNALAWRCATPGKPFMLASCSEDGSLRVFSTTD